MVIILYSYLSYKHESISTTLLRYRRVPTEAPELTDDVKKDLIQDSNQLQEAEAR